MAEKLDPKVIVTLEELAISSMWEIAVLVVVLERQGILPRQGSAGHDPDAASVRACGFSAASTQFVNAMPTYEPGDPF